MHILILHNAVDDDAATADRDVLVQVAAVREVLGALGHHHDTLGCDLNLATVWQYVQDTRPDLVFNLVESLAGTDRLMHLVPALLEVLAIPCTGSSAQALQETGDKIRAKERLAAAGLPTASWHVPGDRRSSSFVPGRYIIKAIHEHASFGLDDQCLFNATTVSELLQRVRRVEHDWQRPCFAERYIEGREFNLSLLASNGSASTGGVEVLPPAEIEFVGYGPDKPRIVGYRAKWDEDSSEYRGTPRRFDFGPEDADLLSRLSDLAVQCWRLWGLGGYARVDFRVGPSGEPWILEVNGNPCLSPDAGFAAALDRRGLAMPTAIERIVEDGLRARPGFSVGPRVKEKPAGVSHSTSS